jgi:hypothetical protein
MTWTYDGARARLDLAGLEATVDPTRPFAGLEDVRWQGAPYAAARLLALRTDLARPGEAERVVEAYVRGVDFIATYEESEQRPVRPQIYWRGVSLPAAPCPWSGCELIVSMQTSLLDSDPGLVTATQLPAIEVHRLAVDEERWQIVSLADGAVAGSPADGASPLVFRTAGSEWSYAEMVFPSDFVSFDLRRTIVAAPSGAAPGVELSYRLFGERLEKGVIRRCRVRGLFVPRHCDLDAAREAYADLSAERLPLTT